MSIFTKIIITIICFNLFSPKLYAAPMQEVTILADDSYPPYSFVENGKLQGMYVDIVKEAAKLLEPNYKVNVVAYPWKRALHELEEGTAFALLPPYKHIEKRPYIWPYSIPIVQEVVVAFCHKDINLVEQIDPKANKSIDPLLIGINAGYLILNQELEKAEKAKKIIVRENKSTFANIMKLFFNRLDCYLNDRHSTYWELSQLTKEREINFDNIKETLVVMSQTGHIGYTSTPTHNFLFKDDFTPRMDKALSSVLSSSKYQQIVNRYITLK